MSTSPDEKRKRVHRSGALGLVLAAAEASQQPSTVSAVDASQDTTVAAPPVVRPAQRFFPTKGFGRVPAKVCRPWRLADRPADEFSHTVSLAKSIAANGQVQPALVRVVNDPNQPDIRYEVIAGVARWRSALNSESEFDVQIRDLNDAQAYRAMVAENEDRQNLSDFARAKRFARALEEGVVNNKTELAELAHLSAVQLSYFIGFASLPDIVLKAISDVRAIPVRLGYVLANAHREGFEAELIRDMPLIESGEISRDRIPEVWRAERAGEQRANESVSASKRTGETVTSATATNVRKIKDSSGLEVCRVKSAPTGAVSLKIPARLGKRISESQLDRIVAILIEPSA